MPNSFTIDQKFPFVDTSNLQSVDRDNQQAYTLLRLITTPFEKYKAFKFGIIDKNGNELKNYKSLKSYEEKKSYSRLVRLMIALKKIIERYPQEKVNFRNVYLALKSINEGIPYSKLIKENPSLCEEICHIKVMLLLNEDGAPSISTCSVANYTTPITKKNVKRHEEDELLHQEI